MSGHTPGPWRVYVHGRPMNDPTMPLMWWLSRDDAKPHASLGTDKEADARLIAAAPELLDALADMLSGWRYIRETYGDLGGVGWDRAEKAARAAIAKARGES